MLVFLLQRGLKQLRSEHVLDQKSIRAFVKARENLLMRNSLLYHKLWLKVTGEDVWHFVVPKTHCSVALDGFH